MVKTDGEEVFEKEALKLLADFDIKAELYFFKKKLKTSKGLAYDTPLFRGYVFMGIEELTLQVQALIKKSPNFYHFLNSNQDIQPLLGKDLLYLQQLIRFGELQDFSKVDFDVNGRIVVKDGPLSGFSGNIIRVNKKMKRVTVAVEMFGSLVKFDLGYEEINKV